MTASRAFLVAALLGIAVPATAQVPPVYVPESGAVSPGLRQPDLIQPPPASRYDNRPSARATVPSPTSLAGRIEVPDAVRRGETVQDRTARCQHYGTLYGVSPEQRAGYVHRCIHGN